MSIRRAVLPLLTAFLLMPTWLSAAERWPAVRVGQGPSEQRIFEELDKPTDLDFDEAPLQDVLTYLADFHKIPILIDSKSLATSEIKTDIPISIHMAKTSLRSALGILLRNVDLDYVVRDEVLIVTTPEIAQNSAPVCMFDVSMLAPNAGDVEELLSVIQSNAGRSQLQITTYHQILLVKDKQRQQDEIAALLGTLYQLQLQRPPQVASNQ